MSLQQLSTKGQASDYGYENTPGHRSTGPGDVELAHVDAVGANIYDSFQRGDKDEHTYNVAGKVRASSEVTLSRRSAIILVVSGVILSAVISIITGVVVNHVTNGKMTQTDPEVNTSNRLDALEQIQTNVIRLQETLEQKQASTTRVLEMLEHTQANTRQELDKLVQTQANTTRELDNTRGELDNTRGELDTTREELSALGTTLTEASSSIVTMTAGQNAANLQLEILQSKLNNSGQQVAFSVYNLRMVLLNAPTFHFAVTNTGHYNMTSGKFTCPVSGLYYFSLSIEHDSTSNGTVRCIFMIAGTGRVDVTARQGPYEAASGSVISHLSVNDVVWLLCHGGQYLQTANSNSVFSGFLISQD